MLDKAVCGFICLQAATPPADGYADYDDLEETKLASISTNSAAPSSAASAAVSTKSREDLETVRRQLLDTVSRDDVVGVEQQCRRVTGLGLTLSDAEIRDPTDHATALHTALIHDRWKVAEYLIRSTTNERLLDEMYDVTGQFAFCR